MKGVFGYTAVMLAFVFMGLSLSGCNRVVPSAEALSAVKNLRVGDRVVITNKDGLAVVSRVYAIRNTITLNSLDKMVFNKNTSEIALMIDGNGSSGERACIAKKDENLKKCHFILE